MVTVVDPNGTPVPVYTRSGTTIQQIDGNGTTQGDATQIVAVSGWTVVIVNVLSNSDNYSVKLPDDAEIGDLVEVYHNSTSFSHSVRIFPSSGDSIDELSADTYTEVAQNVGRLFRKVTSTNWRAIASAA